MFRRGAFHALTPIIMQQPVHCISLRTGLRANSGGLIFGGFPELQLQLRVFGSGLLVDGNVKVGVFPKVEKTLIGGDGSGSVTLQCVGPGKSKRGERTQGVRDYYSSVVQDFLELRRSQCPLMLA